MERTAKQKEQTLEQLKIANAHLCTLGTLWEASTGKTNYELLEEASLEAIEIFGTFNMLHDGITIPDSHKTIGWLCLCRG